MSWLELFVGRGLRSRAREGDISVKADRRMRQFCLSDGSRERWCFFPPWFRPAIGLIWKREGQFLE
jgi:hypothetical protein